MRGEFQICATVVASCQLGVRQRCAARSPPPPPAPSTITSHHVVLLAQRFMLTDGG